jgi:hypothetical protein
MKKEDEDFNNILRNLALGLIFIFVVWASFFRATALERCTSYCEDQGAELVTFGLYCTCAPKQTENKK